MHYKNSDRIVTTIIGVFSMFIIPIGTIIGIAALYILTNPEAEPICT